MRRIAKFYAVICEGCDKCAPRAHCEEKAIELAEVAGWIDTGEGFYCAECKNGM
jgi:hypothetical protein